MKVVKKLTEDFYPQMLDWWKGQGFTPVSPSMLPEYTFVCLNDEGTPIYSMCFYNTDSNMCWIGWQLGNPYVSVEDRSGGFKFLFEEVERYSISVGYQVMFTTSKTPVVQAMLKGSGYIEGDTNVNHYLKIIT